MTPLAGIVSAMLGGFRSLEETSPSDALEGAEGPDTDGALVRLAESRAVDAEELQGRVARVAGLSDFDYRVERLVWQITRDPVHAIAADDIVRRMEGGQFKNPLQYLAVSVPMRAAELRAGVVERELEEWQSRKPLRHRQYDPRR